MKSLLGITPSGVLCFVSEFYPGSTSDKEITVLSGFLNHLKPGDQVMTDKSFNCQDELASVGASLITPKASNNFPKNRLNIIKQWQVCEFMLKGSWKESKTGTYLIIGSQ
jgi:hypothetical protein